MGDEESKPFLPPGGKGPVLIVDWTLSAIWPSPLSCLCFLEAFSQSPISALMVTMYSQSSMAPGGLGRGQVREGVSAIISFPTLCFQRLVTPQHVFPWWKTSMFGVCSKENLYGKFGKDPLWLGMWKKPVPSHLEKKGKNKLEAWLFLSPFQKELTWIVLLGLHPHHFVGKGIWKGDADSKMLMSLLKNFFFTFSRYSIQIIKCTNLKNLMYTAWWIFT